MSEFEIQSKRWEIATIEQNKAIAKMGGNASKVAKENLEQKLGKSLISNKNNLNYQYIDEKEKLEKKK